MEDKAIENVWNICLNDNVIVYILERGGLIATIKDVAKAAGVSVATVSRVLNGDAKVRPDTREHVLAVIRRSGYAPNAMGRDLRRNSTRRILVLLPEISHGFFSGVVRGLDHVARERGYQLMVSITHSSAELERGYVQMLHTRGADGMILLTSRQTAQELDSLAARYPVVLCSERAENAKVPFVGIDNLRAARDVTSWLLGAGHSKVALLGVDGRYYSSLLREQGYRQALASHGLAVRQEYIMPGDFTFRSGLRGCQRLLRLPDPPTAVFALSDVMAAGALRALHECGRKAGEDVAVFGFDDTALSRMVTPQISTVSQQKNRMGRAAMALLFDRMKDPRGEIQDVYLDYRLILRESAGHPCGGGTPPRVSNQTDKGLDE